MKFISSKSPSKNFSSPDQAVRFEPLFGTLCCFLVAWCNRNQDTTSLIGHLARMQTLPLPHIAADDSECLSAYLDMLLKYPLLSIICYNFSFLPRTQSTEVELITQSCSIGRITWVFQRRYFNNVLVIFAIRSISLLAKAVLYVQHWI